MNKYLTDAVQTTDDEKLKAATLAPTPGAYPPRGSSRPPSMAGSHSGWWKPPGSEAGYSYPETAVTSRVAGSVTESELAFFASKIGQLEQQMAREKERGVMLQEELKRLDAKAEVSPSASGREIKDNAGRTLSQAGATAGVPTTVAQRRVTAQQIRNNRQFNASGKTVGGWGYATLDQMATLKPAAPVSKPRPESRGIGRY